MNKKMKEIHALIEAKIAEAKACKETDIEKAKALMADVKALQEQYEVEKALMAAEKEMVESNIDGEKTKEVLPEGSEKKMSADEVVAAQVKALIGANVPVTKDLSDTVNADGGYTIPVDALTSINHYKEAYAALESEVTVEKVQTKTGTRVYQKRGRPGAFSKLTSNGLGYQAQTTDPESNKMTSPQFEQLAYSIDDYAGYMPVPNNLISDSSANITNTVYEWLGKAAVDTDNGEILGLLGQTGTSPMGTGWTDLVDLDGIKKAVNVTLGQAFAPTAKIYTNDDGAQWLSQLKEKSDSNKSLFTQDPTKAAAQRLAVGFRSLPVVILPNEAMKSVAATSSAGGKIPMIIGNLKDAIVKFDRQQMVIDASKTATIGGVNAFAKNMTLFRAILRADYVLRDSAAVVKGYIGTAKLTS